MMQDEELINLIKENQKWIEKLLEKLDYLVAGQLQKERNEGYNRRCREEEVKARYIPPWGRT